MEKKIAKIEKAILLYGELAENIEGFPFVANEYTAVRSGLILALNILKSERED